MGDYSAADDRSRVHVSAVSVLSSWFEYSTIYECGSIAKHEVTLINRKKITEHVLKLRVMNVSESRNRFYVDFLEKSNEIECKGNARWDQSDGKSLDSSWGIQGELYTLSIDYSYANVEGGLVLNVGKEREGDTMVIP